MNKSLARTNKDVARMFSMTHEQAKYLMTMFHLARLKKKIDTGNNEDPTIDELIEFEKECNEK